VPDATPEPTLPPTVPDHAEPLVEATARPADHAAIERLASGLLPALVAKLGATGLGEIEVREDGWKLRLRRPGGAGSGSWNGTGRRATDRPSRSQPGHEGHGHAPGALEGHRTARHAATTHSSNGSSPPPTPAAAHGDPQPEKRRPAEDPHRAVATSPAVGVFQPRPEAGPGTRVRAGDRLGAVDMLGIPQEVVAPADGVVTGILVETGDAVEYGQELIVLELMTGAGAA
jgi:biotin carboxyl carrier protein